MGKNVAIPFIIIAVLVVVVLAGLLLRISDDRSKMELRRVEAQATRVVTPVPMRPVEMKGRGDTVRHCNLTEGAKIFDLSHTGKRNFIVWLHDNHGGQVLVANDVGRYNGSDLVQVGRRIRSGPCSLEIKADGAWTIGIKSR